MEAGAIYRMELVAGLRRELVVNHILASMFFFHQIDFEQAHLSSTQMGNFGLNNPVCRSCDGVQFITIGMSVS